jgi:cytochrome c-type biogenesis protein CcmF
MSTLGGGVLAAVFLLYSFAAVFALASLRFPTDTARKVLFWVKRAVLLAPLLALAALILLTTAFLKDDFSISVVAEYSSVNLPFFYKLSAVWAGSAGSLLFWSVCMFVLFAFWMLSSGKISFSKKLENGESINDPQANMTFNTVSLSIGSAVCLGFTALLVFVAKPFARCHVTVDEGFGLNPLLQNFWMVIHPPLLFIGYSAFLMPFVIVLAAVFAGRADSSAFYPNTRRWLLFALCFMSLGIVTGARWSYVELGWGGFWAWDPVENASLLPWLIAVAALHSLAGVWVSEKFRFWSLVLLPLPFILCIIATFITRSGILSSQHAFDEKNVMFSALLAFITCALAVWIASVVRAAKTVTVSPPRLGRPLLDKTGLLFWTSIILMATALVVAFATLWPAVWRIAAGSESGLVPTRRFYDIVITAAGLYLVFLLGLMAVTEFHRPNRPLLEAWACTAAGLVTYGLVFKFLDTGFLMSLACGICVFSLGTLTIKIMRGTGRMSSSICHLGLIFLALSAGFSYAKEKTFPANEPLVKGHIVVLGSHYQLFYDSFVHKPKGDVVSAGPLIVLKDEDMKKNLWPHKNIYPNGKTSSEVAIYTGLLEDVYLSFDDLTPDGGVLVSAKIKPMMLWLWFALLLILAGFAFSLVAGKKRKKQKKSTGDL